jgi:hypothetical protein
MPYTKRFRLLGPDLCCPDTLRSKMLLLKKKKYAALALYEDPQGVITTRKEVKGAFLVRTRRKSWSISMCYRARYCA